MVGRAPDVEGTLTPRATSRPAMHLRRIGAAAALGLGIGLAVLAAALYARAVTMEAASMEDLGLVVGALLALAIAGIAFAVSLLLARLPLARWKVVVAAVGCVLALLPAAALASSGTPAMIVLGFLVGLLAVVALARGLALLRAPLRHA